MDRSIQYSPELTSDLFRWLGRASGCTLIIAWLAFVVAEVFRSGPPSSTSAASQAGALAVVFMGYLIGWRNELAGGLLAFFGTIAFLMIIYQVTLGAMPQLGALGFAVPGLLYLAAWRKDHRPDRAQ